MNHSTKVDFQHHAEHDDLGPGDIAILDDDAVEGAQEEEDDEEVPGPAGQSIPLKKSELFKAYQSKGPHQMYCDIMCDDLLRATAHLITYVTRPLHLQYISDLESQAGSTPTIIQWNVSWLF